MKRPWILGIAGGLLAGLAIAAWPGNPLARVFGHGPDPASVIDTTLTSVQALNRLTVFAAVLTTTATSKAAGPLGIDLLGSRKTVIVPGTVRYDVDFSRVSRRDLVWDAATSTLTVNIPEPIVGDPAIDLRRLVTYKDGELVMALTGSEPLLDDANAKAATASLRTLAGAPLLMDMARKAGRAAITNNFELPLHAAGVGAQVRVRFPGDRI